METIEVVQTIYINLPSVYNVPNKLPSQDDFRIFGRDEDINDTQNAD